MSEANNKTAITFVCVNVYPFFDRSVNSSIGGMETRAALFARGLVSSGRWEVCFSVNDFGQSKRTLREGISFDIYQHIHRRASENVNPRFIKRKWLPTLNLDRRDLFLLWQIPLLAMFRFFPAWFFPIYWRRRPSQMVCCFGNNEVTAQIIADCRRLSIKTVMCLASDSDLDSDYLPGDHSLNDYSTPKWMAHYSLEMADHIFVQTESQLRALASRFGRRGEIIRNPVQITADDPAGWPTRSGRNAILWIGRSDTFHKQPLVFLQLAKRCPDLSFLMIVNKTHAHVFDALQAGCPPNLIIIERVPHPEIWNYYRRARVFVSTSAYEGFPNTFLQCAVAGVPVTSLTVDPEGMLSQHHCGLLAGGDLDKLERDVRSLWADDDLAESYALNFHRYALAHHGLDNQIQRVEALLQRVIESPPRQPPLPWWHQPHRRFVRGPKA
jgi:glycosyltransferase involved in cell wall biosynthesis